MTITTQTFHFDIAELQQIFLKYNLCPERPIDYQKFVQDVHEATTVVQTFNSFDNLNFAGDGSVNITVVPPTK